MILCHDCLYLDRCDIPISEDTECDWYKPDDRDEYYEDYVKYVSEFDEDFLYE